MRSLTFLLFILIINSSCNNKNQESTYDLAIENVRIFDSKSKQVLKNKTILINSDTIASIEAVSKKYNAKKIIKGNDKLIVSGFIDTHMHLSQIYGDGDNTAPETLDDSYRKILSEKYLAYGTTTVFDMGMPEKWMNRTLEWQKNPLPEYPNLFITGGALKSDEEREPNMNHAEIQNLDSAKRKIQEYAKLGVQHLKLYWRLRKPEMKAIVEEAKVQNLSTYAHTDQNIVTINEAMDLGVINFEHFFTLIPSVITYYEHLEKFKNKYNLTRYSTSDEFAAAMTMLFEYVKTNPEVNAKLNTLIERLAAEKASISTTINVLASAAGKSYFFASFDTYPIRQEPDLPNFSEENKEELKKAFDSLMQTLKSAHDEGVKIRIGTDCNNGGQALLSELMLLFEANFSIEDILQIATLNGAESMNVQDKYGSIEIGKKADLILFDKSPFDNYKNFLSKKIVIKGGKVFEPKESTAELMLKTINEKGVESAKEWLEKLKVSSVKREEINNVGFSLFSSGKVQDALTIFKLKSDKINNDYNSLTEDNLNIEGYNLMQKGNFKDAVEIFKYNVEKYPNSGNAYDSLGEAYLAYGNKQLAKENYKKAVEINPENTNAIEILRKL